jgi:hypothetical protein
MVSTRILLFSALAGWLGALAGCNSPESGGAATVAFAAARQATGPVMIEGILEAASLRRDTGKPVEFTLREESSANQMRVVAPPEVTVPANITSATYVTVTGTYDGEARRFVATRVETRVPTRDEQPRG